jgi:hypothetical protein
LGIFLFISLAFIDKKILSMSFCKAQKMDIPLSGLYRNLDVFLTTILPIVFYIQVNPTKTKIKIAGEWVKVGQFTTSNTDTFNKAVTLPGQFHDVGTVHICLKNTSTNAISRKTIYP